MEQIKESLERYVNHRVPTGGFLHAVLTNNLIGAACRSNREYVNPLIEDSYEFVRDSILQALDSLTLPKENQVRKAMILIQTDPNCDVKILYKCGGTGSYFESGIKGLIEGSDGLDEEIMYYKRYGLTLESVLLTKERVVEAIKKYNNSSKAAKEMAHHFVMSAMHHYGKRAYQGKIFKAFGWSYSNEHTTADIMKSLVHKEAKRLRHVRMKDLVFTKEKAADVCEYWAESGITKDEYFQRIADGNIREVKDKINPTLICFNVEPIPIDDAK